MPLKDFDEYRDVSFIGLQSRITLIPDDLSYEL